VHTPLIPPPSARDRLDGAALSAGTLLTLVACAHYLREAIRLLHSGENFRATATVVLVSIGLSVVLLAWLYIPSQIRAARLRRSLPGVRVMAAKVDGPTSLELVGMAHGACPRLYSTVAVAVDEAGISLFRGVWRPRLIAVVHWTSITRFDVADVQPLPTLRLDWLRVFADDPRRELHLGLMTERRAGWQLLGRAEHRAIAEILDGECATMTAARPAEYAG
jgi:hypothetical protein